MLPLLKSILISSWIFIFLAVIRELNSTILLYSPKSIVLSVVVWNYMYEGNYNQASVVALIQTAIICIVLLIARVILRIDVNKGGMSI
jgi:iron(III) transport system permease protein